MSISSKTIAVNCSGCRALLTGSKFQSRMARTNSLPLAADEGAYCCRPFGCTWWERVCRILPSSREVSGQLPHHHLDSPADAALALATCAAPASRWSWCGRAPGRGGCTGWACRQGQSLWNKSRCLCLIGFHAKLSSRAVGWFGHRDSQLA